MPVDDPMPEDAIVAALEAARMRVARMERERAELDHAHAAAQEELRLLERLLALRRGAGVAAEPPAAKPAQAPAAGGGKPAVVQAVIDELTAAGRSLHISELMRLLRSRNVEIPGSGTQANLITYLRRDKRFVRPSRGMYGLATWGLENMAAPRRIRRRRKLVRATAAGMRREG